MVDSWAISQALAFLRWRTEEMVEHYREPLGMALAASSRRGDAMYPGDDPTAQMSWSEAEKVLVEALRSGKVRAIQSGAALPPEHWLTFTLFDASVSDCRFSDQSIRALAKGMARPKPPGRPSKYNWSRLDAKVEQWLETEGAPLPHSGEQHNLEQQVAIWMLPEEPAESTIRKYVAARIARVKARNPK